ncbi:MAG: response regulator [Halothiobacillaceae bacterium]|nr:MAG: response regulator [Halothiobacillaceae bacterium]
MAEARAWLSHVPAPDIALIDLGLPDGSGIELIERLNGTSAATLCVVATIYDDDAHLFPALRAGARGYILKDQGRDEAARLLLGIAAGHPPLSPSIARKILASFQAPLPDPQRPTLTPREHEVLRYISKGMTLSETAQLLQLSRHTVDGYVKEVYRKLNVSSRAEVALAAQRLGLV